MTKEKIKTRKEIADFFGVSVTTVRNWDNEGLIPKIKIGKVYRYNIDDVLKAATQN